VKLSWSTGLKVNAVIFLVTSLEGYIRLLFPPFFSSLGVSTGNIGYFFSLLATAALISRLPGGLWYALKQRRVLLSITVLLMSVTACSFAFPLSLVFIMIALVGHGISFGIVTTLLLALCIDSIESEQKTVGAMALYTAFIAGGYAFGNMSAGLLAGCFGVAAAFGFTIIFSGAAFLLLLTIPWPKLKPGEAVSAVHEKVNKEFSFFRVWYLAKLIFKLPAGVYVAFILVFYINFVNQLVDTYFPLLALQGGITIAVIGMLLGLKSWCATFTRLGSGYIFKKVNYRSANNFCLLASALSTSLLATVLSVPLLIFIFFIIGLGRGVIRVTSAVYMAECHYESVRQKGLASGVYNAGLDLGDILGPVVAGLTVGFWGLSGIFWVFPVLLFIPSYLLVLRATLISEKRNEIKEGH